MTEYERKQMRQYHRQQEMMKKNPAFKAFVKDRKRQAEAQAQLDAMRDPDYGLPTFPEREETEYERYRDEVLRPFM